MQKTETKHKAVRRLRRKHHIRRKIRGVAERPRLTVFRTATNIYAQIIDDDAGRTIVSACTMEKDLRSSLKSRGNSDAAAKVGLRLAEKAKAAKITAVVFDRNGFKFHGRVKALAESARKGGLEF